MRPRAAPVAGRTCFRATSIACRTRTLASARHVMWLGLRSCSASSFCSASAIRVPLAYCDSSLRASSAPGAACTFDGAREQLVSLGGG